MQGVYGGACVEGHTALIYDRGGERRVSQLIDLASCEWNRVQDEKSSASVVITGRACDAQAEVINDIEPRRHELVVFRGDERVWEGPIVQVATRSGTARILAHDIFDYLDHTPLTKDWPWDTGTVVSDHSALMTERAEEIITYELTTNYDMTVGTGMSTTVVEVPRWETIPAPANILPFLEVRHSATLLSRSETLAFEMMLGEHLSNLADGGLEFTVIGRKLLLWDGAESIGRTRTVTEADFDGEPEVIAAGTNLAVIQHVSAQRPDEDHGDDPDPPGVGNAGGPDDYYGVWTDLSSLASEDGAETPTQDALNSQAQRGLVGRSPVPIEVRMPQGVGFRLSHDIGINSLVPGVRMPLLARLNLRRLSQVQRLDSVKVIETAEGERVSVTLVPSGEVTLA